jgi:hypothetical protein
MNSRLVRFSVGDAPLVEAGRPDLAAPDRIDAAMDDGNDIRATARAILRAHGGDVVLSNRPGGGLSARATLPTGSSPNG